MPTRADIEAATPRCGRRVMTKDGQHGVHYICGRPMRYLAFANAWVCHCGGSQHESQIASRRIYATFA